MRNFREYDIWKSAIEIAKEIYLLTEQFPNAEKYGLFHKFNGPRFLSHQTSPKVHQENLKKNLVIIFK